MNISLFHLFIILLFALTVGVVGGAGVSYYVLRNNPKFKTKLDKVNDILASGKLDEETLKKLKDVIQ